MHRLTDSYDESENWETLYQRIATEICTQAEQQPVIYAVPGHPLIGESSVLRVLAMARERGLKTRIVAGLSFIEPICTLLKLDPLEAGAQIVDATMLAALNSDEVAGKVIPTTPLLVTQVYNRRVASAVKFTMSEVILTSWRVKLVRAAGVENDEEVLEIPLYELDRNTREDHLSTLYVPPLDQLTALGCPKRCVSSLCACDVTRMVARWTASRRTNRCFAMCWRRPTRWCRR